MNSDNIISVNVPNFFTVGVFLLIWALVFVGIAQVVRKSKNADQ